MHLKNELFLIGDVTMPPKINKAGTGFWCGIRVYNTLLNFFIPMDVYVQSGLNLSVGQRIEAEGHFYNGDSGNYIAIKKIKNTSLKNEDLNVVNIEGYLMIPIEPEILEHGKKIPSYLSILRHYNGDKFNDINFKAFDERVINGYDLGDFFEVNGGKIIYSNKRLFLVPTFLGQNEAGLIKSKKL